MRNLVLFAALFAAFPLAAQDKPQDKPADPQESSSKPAPTLENPTTAAPDPAEKAPAKPVAKITKPAGPPAPRPEAASSRTIEEIIARVNNEIITKTDYEKARASADEDTRQECANKCTPQQLQEEIDARQKTTLRDLIDQSLLVQRGKDMGVSVEPDVIKQLDQIRISNKLDTMEALEKAVEGQGLNWEDFKDGIRKKLLTDKVISQEVGSHINITKDEVQKYYDEHKQEFERPEQVALRAIEVNTEGKSPDELAKLKEKANKALSRINDGEDFGEIAKRYSDGTTKDQGGYLGTYKHGELSKELEDRVFKMKKNELTPVLDTKQGFLILQVMEHYDEGIQPLSKVESVIMNQLYGQRMEPAVREYLKTLREQSYVIIKPGYAELGGGGNSEIQEVSATPEASKNKKSSGKKWYKPFGGSKDKDKT